MTSRVRYQNTSNGKGKKIRRRATAKTDRKNLPEAYLSVTLHPAGNKWFKDVKSSGHRDYDLFTFKGILSGDDPSHSKWGLTDSTAAKKQSDEEHWYDRIHGINASGPSLSSLTSAHGPDNQTAIQSLFNDGPHIDFLEDACDGITIVSTKLRTPGAGVGTGRDLYKFNVVFSQARLARINPGAAAVYAQGGPVVDPAGQGDQPYDFFVHDPNQTTPQQDPSGVGNPEGLPMFSLELRENAIKVPNIRSFLRLVREHVRGDETSTRTGAPPGDFNKYQEAHLFRQMLARYYINLVNSKVEGRMLEPMFCFIRRKEDGKTLFDHKYCIFGYWFGVRNFDVKSEWPLKDNAEVKVKGARGATQTLRFQDVKASLIKFSGFLHLGRSTLVNIRELELSAALNHIPGLFTSQTIATAVPPIPAMSWFIADGVAVAVAVPQPTGEYAAAFATPAVKSATLQKDIQAYCTSLYTLMNVLNNSPTHTLGAGDLQRFTLNSKILVSCIGTRITGAIDGLDVSGVINPLIISQLTADIRELLDKHKMLTKRYIAPALIEIINPVSLPEANYKRIVANIEDTDKKISLLSANVGLQVAKIFEKLQKQSNDKKILTKRLMITFKPDVRDTKIYTFTKKGNLFGASRTSTKGFTNCDLLNGTPKGAITIVVGDTKRSGSSFIDRSTWIDAYRFFQFNGLDLAADDTIAEIGDSYGLFGTTMIAQAATRRAIGHGVREDGTIAGLVATCHAAQDYLNSLLGNGNITPPPYVQMEDQDVISGDASPGQLWGADAMVGTPGFRKQHTDKRLTMAEWRKIYYLLHENCGVGIQGNDPAARCLPYAGAAGAAGSPGPDGGYYNATAACGWNQIPRGLGVVTNANFKRPLAPPAAIQVPNNGTDPIRGIQDHPTLGFVLNDFDMPLPQSTNAAGVVAQHPYDANMHHYNTLIAKNYPSVFQNIGGVGFQFGVYMCAAPIINALIAGPAVASTLNGVTALDPVGSNNYQSFMLVAAAGAGPVTGAAGTGADNVAMRNTYKQDIQLTLDLVKTATRRAQSLLKIKQSHMMANAMHTATGRQVSRHALTTTAPHPGTIMDRSLDNITWGNRMVEIGNKIANIINFYFLASMNSTNYGLAAGALPATIPAMCRTWMRIFGAHIGANNVILTANGTALVYGLGVAPFPNVLNNVVNSGWLNINPAVYVAPVAGVALGIPDGQLLAVFRACSAQAGPGGALNMNQAGVAAPVDVQALKTIVTRPYIVREINALMTLIKAEVLSQQNKCVLLANIYSAYNPNAAFAPGGGGGILAWSKSMLPTVGPVLEMRNAGGAHLQIPPYIPISPAIVPQNSVIANSSNNDHGLLRVLIAQCRRLLARVNGADETYQADLDAVHPENPNNYTNIYGAGGDGANAPGGPNNKLRHRLLWLHRDTLKGLADDLHRDLGLMDLRADSSLMQNHAVTFGTYVNAYKRYISNVPKFFKACYNAGLTFQMLLPRFGFILEAHVPAAPVAGAVPPMLAALAGPAAAVPVGSQYRVNLPAAPAPQGMNIGEVCLLFSQFGVTAAGASNGVSVPGQTEYRNEIEPVGSNYQICDDRLNCPLATYGNVFCVQEDGAKVLVNPGDDRSKFSEMESIFNKLKERKTGRTPYTQHANAAPLPAPGISANLPICRLGTTNNYIVQNPLYDAMINTPVLVANLNGAHTGGAPSNSDIVNFAQYGAAVVLGGGFKYTIGPVSKNGAGANRVADPTVHGVGANFMAGTSLYPGVNALNGGTLVACELFSGFQMCEGKKDDNTALTVVERGSGLLDDGTFIDKIRPYSINAYPELYGRAWDGGEPRCFGGRVRLANYTNPYSINATTLVRMRTLQELTTVQVTQGAVGPGVLAIVPAVGALRNQAAGGFTAVLNHNNGPPTAGQMFPVNSRKDAFLDMIYKEPVAPVAPHIPSACEYFEKITSHVGNLSNIDDFFTVGVATLDIKQIAQAGGGSSAQFGGSAKLCYGSYVNYFNQLYKTNPKLAKKQMKQLFKKIK